MSQRLFCEMSELQPDMEWREVGRWLKFEETVENGGRWSKPHVGTLQLHYLLELKHFLSYGTVVLDLNCMNFPDIIGKFKKKRFKILTENLNVFLIF